ncbi:MAG: non-homologous end-joining DNA ligase [Bryobacterales bacterium]|nr:non-homologous end-joining DNA ligase [Bryobacterales bacterium]
MIEPMGFSFIEPMLLLAEPRLPEGWLYELKLDGYRALAARVDSKVFLRSRNDKDFTRKFPTITAALQALPDKTVIDGEVVALDERGMPSFNLLQNSLSGEVNIVFYAFDVLTLQGKDVMGRTLRDRRKLLETEVLPHLAEPIRFSVTLDAPLQHLIAQVKLYGFEGLVAKNPESTYEPGRRSGAWQKMRLNRGQEFVIGGYTTGGPFDALIFGYYDNDGLRFAAKTRNGFTPPTRAALMQRMQPLITDQCPFLGLPEKRAGRWGQGITAEKMKDCVWLRPELVGQFEFVEWTPDAHLRHSKFIGLREDKDARDVVRET